MPRAKKGAQQGAKSAPKAKRPRAANTSNKTAKARKAPAAEVKSRPASKAPSATRTKAPAKARTSAKAAASASQLIDRRIRELGGWRGASLARMRKLILEADPDISEEWKWDVPVWSHHGIVCTGEAYKKAVKLTFARGASIPDPSRLFNSSLEGNTRRALDIHEGAEVDAKAFKALIKAAVAHNAMPGKKRGD